jgi:hypothetical protein
VPAITQRVRPDVKDAAGWATDVRAALVAAGEVPTADHVCQVLAIVEQESGYQVDPAVPGLADIVDDAIDAQLGALGPFAGMTREALLSPIPEGSTTSFAEQLRKVKTEQDVDKLFRAILAHHRGRVPTAVGDAAQVLFPGRLERLNPIATAGSMQVSVNFAQDVGRKEGLDRDQVRDALYTRAGGLRYGTARLFEHEADYDRAIYRFADYNAGLYASRNAAFQTILADLTGEDLAPDGDLMIWTDGGRPSGTDGETMRALLAWRAESAPDLTEDRLRRDVRLEKEAAFEETATWRRVRASWTAKKNAEPPYARVPNVTLDSPKIQRKLTTAWFAENVDRRYQACLARGKKK